MNANLLPPNKDPMGYAIADYFSKGKAGRLRVFSSQFDEDEIPVAQLFRTFDEMPILEQKALELAQGKILDCGAGSGCHALALQDMGKDVEAIDISPRSLPAKFTMIPVCPESILSIANILTRRMITATRAIPPMLN